MSEPLLTVSRAARELGLAPHTLRRLVVSGHVPSVDVAGLIRVRLSQVVACLQERSLAI